VTCRHHSVQGETTMANTATLSIVNPSVDTIGIFKSIATACAAYDGSLAIVEGHIETLKTSGVKFGKSKKTCQYRVQMNDAMKVAYKGKAEKTYANYVTSIVAAVNDGAKFSFSASKGKAKGKATEKDETIFPILAKLFSHADFGKLAADLESMFDNDEGHIKQLIQDMLQAEGYEIAE